MEPVKVCSIPDCEDRLYCRGWCMKHYTRWWRYGDPLATAPPRVGDNAGRFWAKVDKTGSCWLWTGSTRANNQGGLPYGQFCLNRKQRSASVHRVAYEWLVGPIPDGYTIDHVRANGCTSTLCVKAVADEHGPAHLEAVTQAENTRRAAAEITHCPKGHPYDEANTYWHRGHRYCRECSRVRKRKRLPA